MSVTLNAKGTSVPYFKLGKTGSTLFQGTSDPTGSFTVINGDVWFDTTANALKFRSSGAWTNASGTVTSTSVASVNGFSGSVANATSTPTITLSTSISGVLVGSSGALVAATPSDLTPLLDSTYVNISGDTMTGTLSLNQTGDQAGGRLIVGDLNAPASITGIYLRSTTKSNINWSAGGILSFNDNGTGTSERMRIDANGNVGISTTPPTSWESGATIAMQGETSFSRYGYSRGIYYDGANYRSISGAAGSQIQMSGGGILLRQSPVTTANATVTMGTSMILDTTGFVGIGVTSPANKLHIVGSGNVVRIDTYGSSSAPGPITRTAQGTVASPTATLLDDFICGSLGMGYGTTGFGPNNTVAMVGRAEANFTDSSQPTYIRFDTTAVNSATRAERMRIDSSGNVGIGISPSYRLHVGQSVAAGYATSAFENTDGTGFTQLYFNVGSNGASGRANISYAPGSSGFFAIGPTANDTLTPITFRNNNATERMRISASGHVGIGLNSNTTYGLQISGTGTFPYLRLSNTSGTYNAKFNITDAGITEIGSHSNTPITFVVNNTEQARIDTAGNVGIGMTPVASNGILQLNSYASIKALLETATVTASAPASTTNFDLITQAVHYYTTNASTNFTLNIRGNSGTSLNAIMQTGQSATMSLLVTNGGTAYRPTAFQIDGNAVTPKWQGGVAPSAGNINSIDIYTFTVIKTASAAFTVLATQTQFA